MTLYALFNKTCPDGWEEFTVDDGRYVYVTNSSITNTAGATSKSHTHAATSTTRTSNAFCSSCFFSSYISHQDTAIDITTTGIKFRMCKIGNNSILTQFPHGTMLISNTNTCPEGWSAYTTGNSKYIKFTETNASAGDSISGNQGGHTHSLNCVTWRVNGSRPAGCDADTTSTNVIDAYTDLYHVKLMLCKRD